MTGFSLWYTHIKGVYDITQLSEAVAKLKLKYYTFQSFTIEVHNVFKIFAICYFESQLFDTWCKTGLSLLSYMPIYRW
jgi:hypothetical protein